MHYGFLELILVVIFSALLASVLFRQFRLSIILGYLIVGALLGPHAFRLVPDTTYLSNIAEFGIVFLMFTVGLEFSIPQLFSLKKAVFLIGGLQVILGIFITTLIGKLLGMDILAAIVVGSIATMSSTAIVVKQLQDQHELHTTHGLNALGILLFQDMAVIPIIILIASLSKLGPEHLLQVFSWAIIKGVFALMLIFMIGRLLLRPLFHLISHTRTIELFTLTVLLVTLAAAWITHTLGLSFALGAFVAGIMLAETEFRHQIEVEIRPFRDILLGLFFVTIGMLTNVSTWADTWIWILLLVFAITIGKSLLIMAISYFAGNNGSDSFRTGVILGQGSEFGFAILALALNENVLPMEYGQVVLGALVISIVMSPLVIRFNKKIAQFVLPRAIRDSESTLRRIIYKHSKKLKDHIIICGHGRVGQSISHFLTKVNVPYIGLDLDSRLVKRAREVGDNVMFGDASHPLILRAVQIKKAKALVISLGEYEAAKRILKIVRAQHPELPILIRCRDQIELNEFKNLGATDTIAELFETSLTFCNHLLRLLNVPPEKISTIIEEIRESDYELLKQVFINSDQNHERD